MSKWAERVRPVLLVGFSLMVLQGLGFGIYRFVQARRAPSTSGAAAEAIPDALPDVELRQYDGSPLRTGDLHGQVTLLHFWATWCVPCRRELPTLLALAKAEPRLQLVAIAVDEAPSTVEHFFGGEVPKQIYFDPEGTLVPTYQVHSLPDSFLIGADGATVRYRGARDWSSASMHGIVARMLGP